VLIVAPHPDDETLGCGGAIALLAAKGYDLQVLVISDGTGSHPHSQTHPAPVLESIRSQETIAALGILGVDPGSIAFLHLKDGAIPTITAPEAKKYTATLNALPRNLYNSGFEIGGSIRLGRWELLSSAPPI
jgi:LmbE family N-acetylglucosaminyl deacetylase